jgi:hypothetical protein
VTVIYHLPSNDLIKKKERKEGVKEGEMRKKEREKERK